MIYGIIYYLAIPIISIVEQPFVIEKSNRKTTEIWKLRDYQ